MRFRLHTQDNESSFRKRTVARHNVAAFLVCVLSLISNKDCVAGEISSAPSLAEIQRSLTAHRKAISEVSYRYEIRLNERRQLAFFATDGLRFRHSSLYVPPNPEDGYAMPTDVAWDGRFSYSRRQLGSVERSASKTLYQPNGRTLDEAIRMYADDALIAPDWMKPPYDVMSIRRLADHPTVVEVHLKHSQGGEIVSLHDSSRQMQYLGWTYINRGVKQASMTEIDYKQIDSDGNRLYIPVSARIETYTPAGIGNIFVYTVDPSSVQINEPIPDSVFTIQPLPNERLLSFDEMGKVIKAAVNPSWEPIDLLPFPWDHVWRVRQKSKVRVDVQKISEVSPAVQPRRSTVPDAPTAIISPGNPASSASIYTWILAGGLLAVGMGGLSLWWKMRPVPPSNSH